MKVIIIMAFPSFDIFFFLYKCWLMPQHIIANVKKKRRSNEGSAIRAQHVFFQGLAGPSSDGYDQPTDP